MRQGIAPDAIRGQVFRKLSEVRPWVVVVSGAAMIAAVASWRLIGSNYHADVETICEAETRSGLAVSHDWPELTPWVRAHLSTPDGNALYSSLSDAKVEDKAPRLAGEALAARVASCPMVRSFEKLAADAEYRRDVQRLCSKKTLPGLAELDDSARLEAIEQWIDADARAAPTRDLRELLRQAEAPPDRAKVLREAARAMDVLTCDVASVIESPPH
jgi:hypothetical protein